MTPSISVVFITLNEESNLLTALRSVENWVDEIIVVDMKSDDRTPEIAARFGAKVVNHERIPFFDAARKYGVELVKSEWVLVLDADEEISPGLAGVIIEWLRADQLDVIDLPWANLAFSGFGPHESGFPEYHPRLFRKSAVILDGYDGRIHGFFSFKEGSRRKRIAANFPAICVRHYTNPTVVDFVSKINRYTTVEAIQRYDGLRSSIKLVVATLIRPPKAFVRHYLLRRGFLDGWRGLWLSLMFVFYEVLTLAKVWEMTLHDGRVPEAEEAKKLMKELVGREDVRSR